MTYSIIIIRQIIFNVLSLFFFQSKAVALDGEWNKALDYAKRTLILNLVAIIGSVIGLVVILIIMQIIFGVTVY